MVVDEDYLSYGMSGEIIASVCEEIGDKLKAVPKRIAFPDVPIPYSRVLEQFTLPDANKIIKACKEMMR